MISPKVLAAASVALVVLIDLATGQGPPVYTNYMQAQQDFRPPPPPMQPVGYMKPGGYPSRPEMEREYKKQMESEKDQMKEEKKFEKDLKKEGWKSEKDKDEKEGYETTPAPGALSSFSNSMNDAWKSISSIGRKKRAVSEENKVTTAGNPEATTAAGPVDVKQKGSTSSSERSIDSYEYLQYKNQGYVYFKVPKYLVCNA